MEQLFISHVEEDEALAIDIAGALETAGYATWYYERDSVPGPPYLDQASEAIELSAALVLLISSDSLSSNQVTAEVIRAFEIRKPFVPLLQGISHREFQQKNRTWTMALGAAASIAIPHDGPSTIVDRIVAGLTKLAIAPAPRARPAMTEAGTSGEAVTFTVFAPAESRRFESVPVQVWVHTAEQADEVGRRAEEFDADVRRRVSVTVASGVVRGTVLTIDMKVGELAVLALTSRVTWQGEATATLFRLQAPPDLQPSTHICRAELSIGGISLALVNFKMSLVDPRPADMVAPRPRSAYLCYAMADREEVLRRAQLLSTLGLHVVTDLTVLRPAEPWQEQLHRTIDSADLFLLFWSEAARRSQSVEAEWRYALETKGADAIRPIAVETSAPPPPPELAHLHFSASFGSLLQG